jgi:hypothetical protein
VVLFIMACLSGAVLRLFMFCVYSCYAFYSCCVYSGSLGAVLGGEASLVQRMGWVSPVDACFCSFLPGVGSVRAVSLRQWGGECPVSGGLGFISGLCIHCEWCGDRSGVCFHRVRARALCAAGGGGRHIALNGVDLWPGLPLDWLWGVGLSSRWCFWCSGD